MCPPGFTGTRCEQGEEEGELGPRQSDTPQSLGAELWMRRLPLAAAKSQAGPRALTLFFQPAGRAALARAARSSVQALPAAVGSASASRTHTAALADLAGEEASARRVWPHLPFEQPTHCTLAPALLARVPSLLPAQTLAVPWPPLAMTPLSPACTRGHFGADCRLQCQCQNGGTCDRFSGCVCPSGWHGEHCEKSGRTPREPSPLRHSALAGHASPHPRQTRAAGAQEASGWAEARG